MTEHAVVIAGGGPTGLTLAGELALAGIDVVVVERRVSRELEGLRAGGLHSRTIEVLDQRGIADRFLAAGKTAQVVMDISDFPTRHPYGLALWQRDFEHILGGWVDELGVPILRGREVTGCAQDESGVDVQLSGGTMLRAEYLVGCDGGRSIVRKISGIEFAGQAPTKSWLRAEAEFDDEPELGVRPEGGGIGPIDREQGGNPYGVVVAEEQVHTEPMPSIDELRANLIAVYDTDFALRSASIIQRFTDMTRQAESYRHGRVLLAGDAAHVHPPQGGQGLNIGVQDAVNLGWKLAEVVNQTSPESLLDTYHAERHPIGARAIEYTRERVTSGAPDEPSKELAGMLSGLGIHYDLGGDHPLIGRRMPDLDLRTPDGPTRVYNLLHDARWVQLDFRRDVTYDGVWELPVIGEVEPPSAVSIRPDGYVASIER
jgi:2-polyprenyl-6-methoxyphenol hydroxylase-like FAD-dependent oxidoreductase